jgi:hypothetical protein
LSAAVALTEVLFASRDEREGLDTVGVDAGVFYRVTRWFSVDAAAEVMHNRHRPDYALRTGVSWLVGR